MLTTAARETLAGVLPKSKRPSRRKQRKEVVRDSIVFPPRKIFLKFPVVQNVTLCGYRVIANIISKIKMRSY